MKKTLNYGFLMTMILVGTAMTIFGQGPIQKRIDFSINSPFAIRMGEYLLPPGKYVLHQVLENDPNLFALHPEDLTHEPIAMIRTVRIDYQTDKYPDATKIFAEIDESSPDNHPVIQGWTIPGMDGWEVIGVVEKKTGVLSKVASNASPSSKYKLDKSKINFNKYDEKDKRNKIEFKKMDK